MQYLIKFNLYYLVDINLIIQIFILYSSEDQTSGVDQNLLGFLLKMQVLGSYFMDKSQNGVSIKDHKSLLCTVGQGHSNAGFLRSSFEKYSALQAHEQPFLHSPYLCPPYITSGSSTIIWLICLFASYSCYFYFLKSHSSLSVWLIFIHLSSSFHSDVTCEEIPEFFRGTLVTYFPAFQEDPV